MSEGRHSSKSSATARAPRADISRMPYTTCKTRIVDLKSLNLPTDPTTTDSTFRSIYKSFVSSQPGNDQGQKDSRLLQSVITSLVTGIAPPVAFPTETVYGLGADATNPQSIAGIFAAKGRPSDNPLIVHVSSSNHLERCLGGTPSSSAIPQVYQDLLKEFWPGPLTVLIPVPEAGTGVKFAPNVHPGQRTIGFRMPSSPYARFLIAVADRPIAAPSANSSGKPSPTTAQHVYDDLNGKVNFILDGGSCDVGVESTVVDGLSDPPLILRPGGLSKGDLRRWGKRRGNIWQHVENGWEHKRVAKRFRVDDKNIGNISKRVATATNGVNGTQDVFESPAIGSPATEHADLNTENDVEVAPRAPGMKYKHYAPSGRMVLLEGGLEESLSIVQQRLERLVQVAERPSSSSAEEQAVLETKSNGTPLAADLKIGILTSSSWPAFADLQVRWKEVHQAQDSEDGDQAPLLGRALTLVTNNNIETEASGRRRVELQNIDLGRDATSVARNLFAALRKCDDWGCEWIFAEAPSEVVGGLGPVDLEDQDNEFETVLERMRKAASEVVRL